MTSNNQASLPPHNRKRLSHMARTKKTQTRPEKSSSRKVTKSLKLRRPVKMSWRKAWKTMRKKGKPKNSRKKTGKMIKMTRRWRISVLWRRCRRRGPEGSRDNSSKRRRKMTRLKKKRTRERKRVWKMKKGERKRSRRRPKKTEKKSRRMRNRRKSRR